MTNPGESLRPLPALIPLALAGLAACGDADAEGVAAPTVSDSAGVVVVTYPGEALDIEAPFRIAEEPALRIGVVEGDEARQFARVLDGFRTPEGEIVVLDQRGAPLRRFGPDGSVLHTAGTIGEGPAEFARPEVLLPDGTGGAYVLGRNQSRLVRFDRQGEIAADLPHLRRGLDRRAQAVWVGPPDEEGDEEPTVLAIEMGEASRLDPEVTTYSVEDRLQRLRPDGDGGIEAEPLARVDGFVTEMARFETDAGQTGIVMSTPWYWPQPKSAAAPEGLWFTSGGRWEVARYDPEGLERVVRFRREPAPFDEETRRAILDRYDGELPGGEPNWPETIPPIHLIMADGAGRLWLGLTTVLPERLPGGMGATAREWILLEPNGEGVLGRLSVPPRTRPLWADEEGVLLLTVDDLDVPYVEWRELVEG